jgi:hypothetical protein
MLLRDGMTTYPLNLFTPAHDLAGSFVRAFVFFSRSKGDKAIIAMHCCVKAIKTTSETKLLVLRTKRLSLKINGK